MSQHVAVDTDAAAAAIVRLVHDPDLRQSMGNAGRQTVKERFDWPVVAASSSALPRIGRSASCWSGTTQSQCPASIAS